MQNKNIKIAILVSSLANGGAERTSALLSKMLSNLGYDIHIISILNAIDYPFEGKLLNLGALKDENDSLLGRFNRLKVMKAYLDTHHFDLIIDSRSRPVLLKEIGIKRLIYKDYKVLYLVHSSKLDLYLPKSKNALPLMFKPEDHFVCVSTSIAREVKEKYALQNVSTIHNAVDVVNNKLDAKDDISIEDEFVLYFGRLVDKVKNVSLLIDAYHLSKLKSRNVKLVILGDGVDKDDLEKKVRNLKLSQHVLFLPYTKNPFPYIKRAKFTLLTSKYEGFPMVIMESLSVGTPVISVDLPSSKEVLKDGYNGSLITNHDVRSLAEAMDKFILDKGAYDACKKNAEGSVEEFSIANISKKWEALLQEIL
ncbi:glycosyltransferase [Mangrovimonas sp. TPBH4]|uniref:glycosyltransferase n=1 Tax=Mangrovimonas sp. TPBH4 TaxID=1645914 RepID=UPI0012FC1A00|nr:glycosyltransferase [Mangrovimonas sp. TPBH4]